MIQELQCALATKPDVLISFTQLVCSIGGGIFALYLYSRSNQEKKHSLVLVLYDKLYNDPDIKCLLRVLDKGTPEQASEIKSGGNLEQQADKSLRFIDYIDRLVKSRFLSSSDTLLFKYELDLLHGDTGDYKKTIKDYANHLKGMK